MKIVLIGYMASGKSTIGKKLSEILDVQFFDLDELIEAEIGSNIKDIFKNQGEIFFRSMEAQVLCKLFNDKDNFVLATGGGTPCYAKNMETILLRSTHSIYLKLSISNLAKRIAAEAEERPLVMNIPSEDLTEFVGKHLFERSFFYSQARNTVNCDGKSVDEIVKEIEGLLF